MTGPVVIQLEGGAVYLPAASVRLLTALALRGLRDTARDGAQPAGARALVDELAGSMDLGMPKPGLLGMPQAGPPSSSTVASSGDGRGDGEWVGTGGAAALLDVSAEMVRQLAAAERLPARRDDRGAWRLRRVDVLAYRQQRERRSPT